MSTRGPDDRDAARADEAVLAVVERLAQDGPEPDLRALGAAVGLSPGHLQRRVRRATGLSPKELATALRFARFRRLVRADGDVTRAGYAAGFGSGRGLYEPARTALGMTPARYARRGAGLAMTWSIDDCGLGRALVASTADGVCAVLLGDDDAALADELAAEFPAAARRPADRAGDDARHAASTAAVLAHLEDARLPLGVPLDLHGTPFQLRVWRALREVPPGATLSYAELAARLGSPRAARAVGAACARNVVAVLVPCHRVIAGDGSLRGYRWGPARKARLLARERGPR